MCNEDQGLIQVDLSAILDPFDSNQFILEQWEADNLASLSLLCFWLCWVFVAASGLFSSCGEWRLLSSCSVRGSHYGGFSCCRAQALGAPASVVVVPRL